MNTLLNELDEEIKKAQAKHAPMVNSHEAYAVILEEVDEFWDEVRKQTQDRERSAMRKELLHIAAMAMRAIHDLNL